jgi:hypothetical protein
MVRSPFTLLFNGDLLFDRHKLVREMPAAIGTVMAAHFGGDAIAWENAYSRIVEDWESYWNDLNIAAEDSVEQWREGRWRIVRAQFRLSGKAEPDIEQMSFHLDQLPYEIGRRCSAWRSGAMEGLSGLAAYGIKLAVLVPQLPSVLIRGMAEGSGLGEAIHTVLGPDELGQVGLEGVTWERLEYLTKAESGYCLLVNHTRRSPFKAPVLLAPADLADLPELNSRLRA